MLTRVRCVLLCGLLLCGYAAAYAGDDATPLIPRKVIFGNPDKAAARLSPDGTQLSFLAPVDGVMNVWVGPADNVDAAKPVTFDKHRGVRNYFWAYTSRHILYTQDKNGDENWRVYSLNLGTNETKDLTPTEGVQARIEGVSQNFPEEILVGLNDRNPQLHDVYRVNIETGEKSLHLENDGYPSFVFDDDYVVRFAQRFTPDGGTEILKRTAEGGWEPFITVGHDDSMTTSPAGFDKTGHILRMIDSRGRNTAAFTAINLDTGEQTVIAENPRADISGGTGHPTEKTVEAVTFTYLRQEWKILDKSIEPDMAYLRTVADGDFSITSRTLDDKHWLVVYVMDDGPVRYYKYDRPARKAHFLFTNRKALEGVPLAKMHPVVIKSRDGLDLVSYLTLPVGSDKDGDGRPEKPVPLVLNVHGGPWARDGWGYDGYHQWLANRGYAVLAVNFRGSTGLGKDFVNAADKEIGGKMHDDLVDAVKWTIKQRIADPEKIAIFGGSYGGYAVLWGMTTTPDLFACGVDIVGPSSLVTLLESIPPYWVPIVEMFASRMGDHRTEEGRAFLLKRSPLTYVDNICRPLLIGQGANDPRVKQAEADQIVKAMQAKKIPVTYVLFSDEGHGFARPENNLAFNAIMEAFLAEHLGGRFEPIGDDFANSSVQVLAGADEVNGLNEALNDE